MTTWSEEHVATWVSSRLHCPVKFGGHRLCGIENIKHLICHVTPTDHGVRGSFDIMGEFALS